MALQWLVAPITGLIKTWQEGRQKKAEAKATVERILTEASANNAEVAGKIALVMAENQNNTWKDEYALIVISGPVVVGMITGLAEGFGLVAPTTTERVISSMMGPIGLLPEFWQNTFQVGMLSALGVNIWNKARKM